jgi:hypothetical protein
LLGGIFRPESKHLRMRMSSSPHPESGHSSENCTESGTGFMSSFKFWSGGEGGVSDGAKRQQSPFQGVIEQFNIRYMTTCSFQAFNSKANVRSYRWADTRKMVEGLLAESTALITTQYSTLPTSKPRLTSHQTSRMMISR